MFFVMFSLAQVSRRVTQQSNRFANYWNFRWDYDTHTLWALGALCLSLNQSHVRAKRLFSSDLIPKRLFVFSCVQRKKYPSSRVLSIYALNIFSLIHTSDDLFLLFFSSFSVLCATRNNRFGDENEFQDRCLLRTNSH